MTILLGFEGTSRTSKPVKCEVFASNADAKAAATSWSGCGRVAMVVNPTFRKFSTPAGYAEAVVDRSGVEDPDPEPVKKKAAKKVATTKV